MSSYIDADKINAKLMDEYHGMISDESMKIYKIMQMLDNAPTANAQEVKHARWIELIKIRKDGEIRLVHCQNSLYGCFLCTNTANYCSNCGAKMESVEGLEERK